MKHLLLLSILVFAVAAFGQEAPAEEAAEPAMEEAMMDTTMAEDMAADTMAVETEEAMDMLMEDETAAEEAVEEDAGDALEAMLAEEGTEMVAASGSQLIGYTAGVMVGYPVWMSSGLAAGKAAPVFGAIVATPFGFALGPFEIGVGAELGYYDFSDKGDYKGIVALATINTAILETAQGPISVELGGGYYGASVGATAGATYSYAIPGVPLVAKPYVRANATLSSGDNEIGSVAWINAGLYLSYDISTLF